MKKLSNFNNQKGIAQILGLLLVIVLVIAAGYFLINYKNILGNKAPVTGSISNSQAQLTAHYDLNLVGVVTPKGFDTGNYGDATIYLPLEGSCQINLVAGDYIVNDNDCLTDASSTFSLPANSSGDNTATTYAVYVLSLDQTLSSSSDCKTDTTGTYCPTQALVIVRGQDSSFTSDVTNILQYVYLSLGANNTTQKYQIFDDALKNKIWSTDDTGNKRVTLRFYPQSSQTLQQQDSQD